MHLHGVNNFTVDFDISFDRDPANCTALASALNARLRGVPEDLPFILDARTFRNVANLTLDWATSTCSPNRPASNRSWVCGNGRS